MPLRGVLERMGATVVYDDGQINATDRGHTVSVSIGSTRAVVDGQAETLDVAPFIVGASFLRPAALPFAVARRERSLGFDR